MRTLIQQKRFCLNVLERVFPLFNIGVPHTYIAKNKNSVQHDPARYSTIEHTRSRNTDPCLKTKHFLAHATLTLRCLCQCNLQYISFELSKNVLASSKNVPASSKNVFAFWQNKMFLVSAKTFLLCKCAPGLSCKLLGRTNILNSLAHS